MRILVVEDDRAMSSLMRRGLQPDGYRTAATVIQSFTVTGPRGRQP